MRVDGLNPEGIAPMAESTSVASICHKQSENLKYCVQNFIFVDGEIKAAVFVAEFIDVYLIQRLSDSTPVGSRPTEKQEFQLKLL